MFFCCLLLRSGQVGLGQQTPLPPHWPGWAPGCAASQDALSVRITQLYWELGFGCPVRDHQNIKNGLSITRSTGLPG